ncbi:hypothetical protein D9M73_239520 [compost metagenome]
MEARLSPCIACGGMKVMICGASVCPYEVHSTGPNTAWAAQICSGRIGAPPYTR